MSVRIVKSDYVSNISWGQIDLRFGVRSLQDHPFGEVMKRLAVFILLVGLGVAGSMAAQAQRISPKENERQSQRDAKQQEKYLKKANKKQKKNMKKYEKAQRKAMKKANHRHKA
jgi:uncharacterized protein HemX